MADQLIQIVAFVSVPSGDSVMLPHDLNVAGVPQVPDFIALDAVGFTATATATHVVATNNNAEPASVNVWLEFKHSILRSFGAADVQELSPNPFVALGGNPVGAGGFPVGGTPGAPLLSRGLVPSDWSTNNYFGNATIENLDSSALVRYNYRPEINPIDGAGETTAIYVRLIGGFGDPLPQSALYVEIPSNQRYTGAGSATKVDHAGHGDAHYVALLNGTTPRTITEMTGFDVSPIVCTVPGHGFGQRDVVQINGCVGNTAANGTWPEVTILDEDHFSIPGVGNGAYVPDSGEAADITPPIAFEAAAFGDGTVGFSSSVQRRGGAPNWQGFAGLYQQDAILNYAAFNAIELPNNAFSATKRAGLADAAIDGFTQYRIVEPSPRLLGGNGVPGGTYRGPWAGNVNYLVNDTVAFGSSAYAAIAPNTNDQPPSANWVDVTDVANNGRMRIGAFNNGELIQSGLAASAAAALIDSPEHRLRGAVWDAGLVTSVDLDAVFKYVVTDTTPHAELRIYMGPVGAPQLCAILRPDNGGGGDFDLQGGQLVGIGALTLAGEPVTFGPPNSGGAGSRMLIVPN